MDKLQKQILAEKENVETALINLQSAMERKEKSVIELAAIGTFLHNIYSGMENILKQILQAKGTDIPTSATWHKDLLNLCLSAGILSEGLTDNLYKYLTFRHFFVHAYGFMLEEAHIADLAANIPDVWLQFLSEIGCFWEQ
ncbi:MAG: hypothetical protein V2A69_16145 [Pseudomonadota bacterium]